MKISKADKKCIKAYFEWWTTYHYADELTEIRLSKLIENLNLMHRYTVDDYLTELKEKYYKEIARERAEEAFNKYE